LSEQRRVRVELGARAYDVVVGAGVLDQLGETARRAVGDESKRAFLIFDDKLPTPTLERAAASLAGAGFGVARAGATASEKLKTLDTVHTLLRAVAETRHERMDPIVALGGGLVGDVAGFVAATYRRGCPVVQCPTTLLAMVDASVGGKTGVNLETTTGLKKNMAGAFWQPAAVLADVQTLVSLADRELRAGLAECLKHGLLSGGIDDELFEWVGARGEAIRKRDDAALIELVARATTVKARIVERDEREEARGDDPGRAALNLGHTFAHAIEPNPRLSPDGDAAHAPLLHGEAVALGLVAAAACAREMGFVDEAYEGGVRASLEAAGLPTSVAGLPKDEALLEAMGHDKKSAGGAMRLVLPGGMGRVRLVENPPIEAVLVGLGAIRA